MKSFIYWSGVASAAAAAYIVWGPKRVKPVEELAHLLEEAWRDHHTAV